jgi:hypothetical protein
MSLPAPFFPVGGRGQRFPEEALTMLCAHCGRPMRRINPEPEPWIRWTPLYWCVACQRFCFGARPANRPEHPTRAADADARGRVGAAPSG